MRVTWTRDQSGAAGRRHRFTQRRKRGTTLIELVLYISIATVIMTFSIGLLREEQVRRERTALAAELQQVTTALQTYVSANYESIRDRLLRGTPTGSDLIMAYGMNDVVAQGYLPAIFAQTGTTPKSFVDSLQYGLVVRAVRRSQSNYAGGAFPPTQTLTTDLIEPGTGPIEFERTLVDNKYNDTVVDTVTGAVQDDEIDLEALLVTISSDPCRIVPAAQGPRIVSQSETNAAGYVTGLGIGTTVPTTCSAEIRNNLAWTGIETGATALMATGSYGGWRLPLGPYAGLVLTAAEFPNVAGQVFAGQRAVQAGRFVSLLALPQRPPLSESAKIAQDGDSATRCAGVPTNTVTELECQQSDLMYAGLSFTAWDSDNDGTDDTFPGLLNVNTIQMAAPPADGTAQITNLLSLSCATGNTVPTDPTDTEPRFTVDCPKTQMQGLVVTSDAAFDTNVTVASQLVVGETPPTGPSGASAALPTTGKIILNGETGDITMYGESLAEKFTGRQSHTFSGESFLPVDQPDCPTGFDPDISVMPITFKTTQDLRAVETQVTTSGSEWRVKLLVKSESTGSSSATWTETNPPGSKVVVLTGCKTP